jgi:hypothetical protein
VVASEVGTRGLTAQGDAIFELMHLFETGE